MIIKKTRWSHVNKINNNNNVTMDTEQVLSLVEVVRDMGNTFFDDTPELLSLDMRDIIDESVVATIETLGIEQYKSYCNSWAHYKELYCSFQSSKAK